jgi:hypothetical protein
LTGKLRAVAEVMWSTITSAVRSEQREANARTMSSSLAS